MKNKKFRNKIVYVIPPQCVKFLKHKSATPKCHSIEELPEPSPLSIFSNIVNPNDTGITDWLFKPRDTTSKQQLVDETTQTTENAKTTAEAQRTKQTITSLTSKNTFPSITTTSKTSTSAHPRFVITQPKSTYKPSVTETRKTATPTTTNSKSTSVTSPWPIITEPVSTVFEPLTRSKTVSPSTVTSRIWPSVETSPKTFITEPFSTITPPTATSRSTIETSPKPIVTQPLSSTSTEKQKILTPISTVPTTSTSPLTTTKAKYIRDTSKKCYEWYNKIKSTTPSQQSSTTSITPTPKSTIQPTNGKCLKWYDLIKDLKRNPCYKKSVCWEKKSHIECKTSVLSRIDRWLDQRTGMEYLEPVFHSADTKSEENLGNPYMQFLANRQPDNMLTKDVFDHAIEDRLKTLKWLNQQINNQYRMLNKIEKLRRTNPSAGSISKVRIFSQEVRVNGTSGSNRAQRFRDNFIKMKMQRLSIDKNDGWWKNFNAKMYDRKEKNKTVVQFGP